MATQTPYKHSPEDGTPEAEQQPWRIHVPLGSGPVDPDDPTFVSPKRPPKPSAPKPSAPSSKKKGEQPSR